MWTQWCPCSHHRTTITTQTPWTRSTNHEPRKSFKTPQASRKSIHWPRINWMRLHLLVKNQKLCRTMPLLTKKRMPLSTQHNWGMKLFTTVQMATKIRTRILPLESIGCHIRWRLISIMMSQINWVIKDSMKMTCLRENRMNKPKSSRSCTMARGPCLRPAGADVIYRDMMREVATSHLRAQRLIRRSLSTQRGAMMIKTYTAREG